MLFYRKQYQCHQLDLIIRFTQAIIVDVYSDWVKAGNKHIYSKKKNKGHHCTEISKSTLFEQIHLISNRYTLKNYSLDENIKQNQNEYKNLRNILQPNTTKIKFIFTLYSFNRRKYKKIPDVRFVSAYQIGIRNVSLNTGFFITFRDICGSIDNPAQRISRVCFQNVLCRYHDNV